jgi:hypothetical protein
VRITTNAGDDARPALAWDGTHAGLAYVRSTTDGSGELRLALLNTDASVVSDVLVTAFDAQHAVLEAPSLVWTGSEYGLAWLVRRTGNASFDVMFQRFSETLAEKAAALSVGDAPDSDSSGSDYASVSLAFGADGYALAYSDASPRADWQSRLRFRKLGVDGTLPGTANAIGLLTVANFASVSLAIAPDGSYAAAAGYSRGILIGFFNPDGSRTLAPLRLLDEVASSPRPRMLHTGSDWLLAFNAGSGGNLALNSGVSKAIVPLINANGNAISTSAVSVKDGVLSIAYAQPPASSSAELIRFQRFKLPSGASPYLAALHAPVDVLTTQTYPSPGGFAMTSLGSRRSLVTWGDSRWGSTRELYAAVVDAGTCP